MFYGGGNGAASATIVYARIGYRFINPQCECIFLFKNNLLRINIDS